MNRSKHYKRLGKKLRASLDRQGYESLDTRVISTTTGRKAIVWYRGVGYYFDLRRAWWLGRRFEIGQRSFHMRRLRGRAFSRMSPEEFNANFGQRKRGAA